MTSRFDKRFDAEGALIENPSRGPDDFPCDEASSSYAPNPAYYLPLDQGAGANGSTAGAATTSGIPDANFIPTGQISYSLPLEYGLHADLEAWFLPVGPPASPEALHNVHNASYMLFGMPPSELPPDVCRALIQNIDLLPKAGKQHTIHLSCMIIYILFSKKFITVVNKLHPLLTCPAVQAK